MHTLTPDEAYKLIKSLYACEHIMRDNLLQQKTTVEEVYRCVWQTICYHTNAFMFKTVYCIKGIDPPVE